MHARTCSAQHRAGAGRAWQSAAIEECAATALPHTYLFPPASRHVHITYQVSVDLSSIDGYGREKMFLTVLTRIPAPGLFVPVVTHAGGTPCTGAKYKHATRDSIETATRVMFLSSKSHVPDSYGWRAAYFIACHTTLHHTTPPHQSTPHHTHYSPAFQLYPSGQSMERSWDQSWHMAPLTMTAQAPTATYARALLRSQCDPRLARGSERRQVPHHRCLESVN